MGKFIAVMPMAVIAMLVISLFESIFILPCHLAHEDSLFFRAMGLLFYPLRFIAHLFARINKRTAELSAELDVIELTEKQLRMLKTVGEDQAQVQRLTEMITERAGHP
ncbi:MAG: hypothetical protein IH802_04145 [Nitrospinae bacterium]|nr:hypothetical protein [Nitrospinota bacterium]